MKKLVNGKPKTLTSSEKTARTAEEAEWEAGRVERERIAALTDVLATTENPGSLARKLEEIVDYIDTGAPISETTKAWAAGRKAVRS